MENESFLRGDFTAEDDKELSLRPATLQEFLGQPSLKENLSVFIRAARERREALDHLFLAGPPGLGKNDPCGHSRRRNAG